MGVTITGLDESMGQIFIKMGLGSEAAKLALKDVALAYQSDVQHEAPVDTGQYRSGIYTQAVADGYVVGSSAPQAARLEFGFADTDSLGRKYNQPAQPHWRPPLDNNKEEYRMIIIRRVNEAINNG